MAAPPRVEPHNGREVLVGVPLRDVEDSEGKLNMLKQTTKQNLAPKIIESEKSPTQMTEMSFEMK